MSLLTHLHRKGPQDRTAAPQISCPHWELAPRWDAVDDIGHTDRITYYVCANCGVRVSREGAAAR
jgi:hypothetical protein